MVLKKHSVATSLGSALKTLCRNKSRQCPNIIMALNVLQEPEKSECPNCQKQSHWAGYVVQSRKV